MITPDDEILPDDSDSSEADDQQSQKDIHSIGLDETPVAENSTDTDILKQSYDASESAYTLNLGNEKPAPKKKE
jgi:hypothetical protein